MLLKSKAKEVTTPSRNGRTSRKASEMQSIIDAVGLLLESPVLPSGSGKYSTLPYELGGLQEKSVPSRYW
jgi:hypothetical protein